MLAAAVLFLPAVCAAEPATSADTAPKQISQPAMVIGQNAANFEESAKNAAKMGFYFLAALVLGASLIKRWQRRGTTLENGRIQILSRRGVAPKSSLLLVEVDGHKVLLAECAEDVKLLTAFEGSPAFGGSYAALQEELYNPPVQDQAASAANE